MTCAHVGIVGIGNMGLGMALRLLDLGYPVRVRDIDAAREHWRRPHGATVLRRCRGRWRRAASC